MERNEKIGLRSIVVTLAGSNTAAYVAGRYADALMSDVAFHEWVKLGIVVLIIIAIYYGAYRLIERIIGRERKRDRAESTHVRLASNPARSQQFSILIPSIPPRGIWMLQFLRAQPSRISLEAFTRDFGQYVAPDELQTALEALARHALIERTNTTIAITVDGLEFLGFIDSAKPITNMRPETRERVKTWLYELQTIEAQLRD